MFLNILTYSYDLGWIYALQNKLGHSDMYHMFVNTIGTKPKP